MVKNGERLYFTILCLRDKLGGHWGRQGINRISDEIRVIWVQMTSLRGSDCTLECDTGYNISAWVTNPISPVYTLQPP